MIGSHDYGEYTYNNDQACEVAGTKSATCARCGDVNTIADEEHPALEHSFLDYADVADSATCQHGSKSVAICENGCGKEDVKYSDDVLECVFEEIVAPKNLMTPADYENAAVYYKSCKWCGEFEKNGEDYVTFSFGEALVDKFADGELLVGLNVNKFETDQPASGKFNERITSEVVDDATNYFLRAEKIAAGGSNYVRFTTELVEGATEYVYEFKFRWGGTTAQPSDGGAMMFKLMKDCSKSDDSNRLAFLGYGNSSAVGADLSIGGATAAVNTWVNFKCVIKLTEDGKWATTITVNDTVAFTATVSNTSVPVFMLETRYANTYSMYFDVDDVVVYAK